MSGVSDDIRERIESDPYCRTLGIDVVGLEEGYAETTLTISKELLNFHGTPHGGVIYSLADAALAAASNARGDTAVALETNISYLEAVDTGATLTASATESHLAGSTAEYEVEVTTGGGQKVATFRGRVYLP